MSFAKGVDVMGAAEQQREHIPRSPRIVSPLGRDGSYVRYMGAGSAFGGYKTAQLADVSHTGARLISRTPIRANVGDFMSVEFALAGSDRKIKSQARVVRKINEFVFAVRFISVGDEQKFTIETSIAEHLRYRRFPATGLIRGLRQWAIDHKEGLAVSAFALTVAIGIGVAIYWTTDNGSSARSQSWGRAMPKEWYWDYVNHFNK